MGANLRAAAGVRVGNPANAVWFIAHAQGAAPE